MISKFGRLWQNFKNKAQQWLWSNKEYHWLKGMHIITRSTKTLAGSFKISDSQNWQNVGVLPILKKPKIKERARHPSNKKHICILKMPNNHMKYLYIKTTQNFRLSKIDKTRKFYRFQRTWKIKQTTSSKHARCIQGNHIWDWNHNVHNISTQLVKFQK